MNDDPSVLTLQYSSSTAWQSGIIRRMCHSPFSHVDVVLLGEGLLGASGGPQKYERADGTVYHDPGGVIIRPFDAWSYEIKQTIRVRTPRAEAVRSRWRTQIGKPFDDGALWDFLSDKPGERDWRDEASWFCSEGVVWSAEIEGAFGWPLLVAKNRVSPSDSLLAFNSMILEEDVAHLRALLVARNDARAAGQDVPTGEKLR